MQDETEQYRRQRQAELNAQAGLTENKDAERARLEKAFGEVWNTDEMRERFDVLGFLAPYVIVRERGTDKKGTLEFQHSPRFYFGWRED